MGGARSKTQHFCVIWVPFDYPAHSLQETVLLQTNGTVLMESRDSEGVPFASLESL